MSDPNVNEQPAGVAGGSLHGVVRRAGPHVSITPRREWLTCTGCDYLKHNLVRSGRDPQWECLCLHPRAQEVAESMPRVGRVWSTNGSPGCWIGEQPENPEWCPERRSNKPS